MKELQRVPTIDLREQYLTSLSDFMAEDTKLSIWGGNLTFKEFCSQGGPLCVNNFDLKVNKITLEKYKKAMVDLLLKKMFENGRPFFSRSRKEAFVTRKELEEITNPFKKIDLVLDFVNEKKNSTVRIIDKRGGRAVCF